MIPKLEYDLLYRCVETGYRCGGNLDEDDRLLDYATLILKQVGLSRPIAWMDDLKEIRDHIKSRLNHDQ